MYTIDGLKFEQTCSACPEQYDVYGALVHLRHGSFTVYNASGLLIFHDNPPRADGIFEDEYQRMEYLQKAADAINADDQARADAVFDTSDEAVQKFHEDYCDTYMTIEQTRSMLVDDEIIRFIDPRSGRSAKAWVSQDPEDYSKPIFYSNWV